MANYDFNNFYEWPLLIRYLMMGLAFSLVFYVGYYFDISKLSLKAAAVKQQEESLKQQLKIVYTKKASLEEQLTQLPKLANILENWRSTFTKPKDFPELLNQILKIGKANQLDFNFFNPGSDVKYDIYTYTPIKVVVVGSFHQIATFISQIASMPTVVVVDDFTIAKPGLEPAGSTAIVPPGSLTANILLKVFHYDKNDKPI